jgi:predicted nucleic acid-binding protein
VPVFLDTNVIVYALDRSEPYKREIAMRLLDDPSADFVISAQVLSEFYVVTTTKLDPPLSHDNARAALDHLCRLPVVALDDRLVADATEVAREHELSLWDAQIVQAAIRTGCEKVLTEDLNHGQEIAGVGISNPFA